MHKQQIIALFQQGFPEQFRDTVAEVMEGMVIDYDYYCDHLFQQPLIQLPSGQTIQIPFRISIDTYKPHYLSELRRLIYDIICSRSTNGYVREIATRCLSRVRATPEWVYPYLFASMADYVYEVATIISPDYRDINQLKILCDLNPKLYRLTLARATSYHGAKSQRNPGDVIEVLGVFKPS